MKTLFGGLYRFPIFGDFTVDCIVFGIVWIAVALFLFRWLRRATTPWLRTTVTLLAITFVVTLCADITAQLLYNSAQVSVMKVYQYPAWWNSSTEWWIKLPLRFRGATYPAMVVLLIAFPVTLYARRSWVRLAHGQCGACGYDLTGVESSQCPECGHRRNGYPVTAPLGAPA